MLFSGVRKLSVTVLHSRVTPSWYSASTRFFSIKADPSQKITQAVQSFVDTRRVELEQHEAADAADKEETTRLIANLKNAKVDNSTVWSALGFDGLDEVEIVLAIEEALGITLSDDEFHSIRSVSDAVEVFSKYTAKVG